MSIHEIVLPETKPETEWVRGRALQKVSPTYRHSVLQRLLSTAVGGWADSGRRGRVGTEWRFRVAPPGAIIRPLVPDVAFLSYDALPADAAWDDVDVPVGAPTVAIEIRSPDDRSRDVHHKIRTYLSAGTAAVIIVDGHRKTVAVHDADGVHVLSPGDRLTHAALPGFSLELLDLFAPVSR